MKHLTLIVNCKHVWAFLTILIVSLLSSFLSPFFIPYTFHSNFCFLFLLYYLSPYLFLLYYLSPSLFLLFSLSLSLSLPFLLSLSLSLFSLSLSLFSLSLSYFESGVCSVYLWDLDHGFAGVVLIKKAGDTEKVKGCWDSIHVVEVLEKAQGRSAHYKLTSTVMLWLQVSHAHF